MKGLVLGTLGATGKIDNVTVNNANAMAVLGTANSAALAELTVTGVQNLNYVVADMNLTAGLDLTEDWATVSGVKTAVFGSLNAGADANNDYHHVVKLPATADYAKLAKYIGTDVNVIYVILPADIDLSWKRIRSDIREKKNRSDVPYFALVRQKEQYDKSLELGFDDENVQDVIYAE
jgi:hypothetical protein